MLKRRTQLPRGEVDQAALDLLARHGPQILATARRYATTPEDAEDAYQRAFEILLTKAPTTSEEELVPWLRTVVKHEAFALRRQRERHSPVTDDGELADRGTPAAATHDKAEHYERLRQGAEALRQLKPQEVRALLLRAEGYSYAEICELTGWTYTKVNRALTEGRRALTIKLAGIQGGIECAKLAPQLSALADGEASAADLALLRPHMKTCLTCRATLKEFRAAPARVAALVPSAGLAAAGDGGGLREAVESALGAFQEKAEALFAAAQQKAAALGERAHSAAELAMGQKVAAVAASAAALAGGGTAVDQLANHHGPPARAAHAVEQSDTQAEARPAPTPAPEQTTPASDQSAPAQPTSTEPTPAPAPAPTPAPEPQQPPPPNPATEFGPGTAAVASAAATQAQPAAPAATAGAQGGAAPAPPRPAPGQPAPAAGGGAGEFAP